MTWKHKIPQTLYGLVSHYSPSESETEAARWLVEHMQSLNASKAFIDEAGNAVGIWGKGSRQIALLGHIDTVPGEIDLKFEEDCFFGRGAVDAKGALAAFVDSAATVAINDAFQIIVIGAIDEEKHSRGAHFIKNQYHPEFAIIGEPSHWNRITLGYKGSAYFSVKVKKPASHSASCNTSACEDAFSFWQKLLTWQNRANESIKTNFDQIQSKLVGFTSRHNGNVDEAQMQINIRLPQAINPDDCLEQLKTFADFVQVTMHDNAIAACKVDKNNALVRAFLKSIRGHGGQPGFVLKSGTADMNIVAPVWQCPLVAYGAGDSNLDHTPIENIDIQEYSRSVNVLADVLQTLINT